MYGLKLTWIEPGENAESTAFVGIKELNLENFFCYHPDGSAEVIHIDEQAVIEFAHRINTTDVASVGDDQIAEYAFGVRQKEAELA